MGLGKGRLAAALCVMRGMKRNLITLDASLVLEILEELSGLPTPPERWQVIGSPADLACLKTVNVISYQKVRQPLCGQHPRRTYARMLRRRIGIMERADIATYLNNLLESRRFKPLFIRSTRRKYNLLYENAHRDRQAPDETVSKNQNRGGGETFTGDR